MLTNKPLLNCAADLAAKATLNGLPEEALRAEDPAGACPAHPAAQPPTQAERQQVIDAFQREALTNSDLLQANLDMLTGDLLTIATRQRAYFDDLLKRSDGASVGPEIQQCAATMVLLGRQIHRMAQPLRRTEPEPVSHRGGFSGGLAPRVGLAAFRSF